MIIDAFKNKIFPLVPSGFDEDEDEDEDKKDSRLPKIEEEEEEPKEGFEQITRLDKFYAADLINKCFKVFNRKVFHRSYKPIKKL